MFEKFDLDYLQEVVNNSFSFKELLDNLGYSHNSGSTYLLLRQYLIDNDIDFSYFKFSDYSSTSYKHDLDEILVLNPPFTVVNQKLIRRLVKANLLEYKCSKCGNLGVWNNKPLVLQLEHKNGNNLDFRLKNLCLLCPNCHSQTSTYAGRNRNAYSKPYYVDEIKDLLLNSTMTMESIAYKFGLNRDTVVNINNGYTYKDSDITYPIRKRKILENETVNFCPNCGKKIKLTSKLCVHCEGLRRRETILPPVTRNELKNLIRSKSFTYIGDLFGVSDNAVRKWCKKYDLPYRSSDIKSYNDADWISI